MLYTSPVPHLHSPPHSCEQDRTGPTPAGRSLLMLHQEQGTICASKGYSDPHTVLTGHHPPKVGKHCRTLLPWASGTRRHLTFSFTHSCEWFSQAPGYLQQVMLIPWDAASGGSPLESPPNPSSTQRAKMQQDSSTEPPASLRPTATRVTPQVKRS